MAETSRFSLNYVDSIKILEDFRPLYTPEEYDRKVALVSLCDRLGAAFEKRNTSPFFNCALPQLLRLSKDCPYANVREQLTLLLRDFAKQGYTLPSIPPVPTLINGAGDEFNFLFTPRHKSTVYLTQLFASCGRVSHLDSFLSIIPEYAEEFVLTRYFLMNEEGFLPHDQRQYIAIMAASRYHCEYLVKLHSFQFIEANGNPSWLEKLSNAPEKLQKLSVINALLAHRPWALDVKIISSLLDDSTWALAELIHACMILTQIHMSCCLVEGFHITPELDILSIESKACRSVLFTAVENTKTNEPVGSKLRQEEAMRTNNLVKLLRKGVDHNIKVISDNEQEETTMDPFYNASNVNIEYTLEGSLDALVTQVKVCKRNSQSLGKPTTTQPLVTISDQSVASTFRGGIEMRHVDVGTQKRLKQNDFSWEMQGYPLVQDHYPEFAKQLDSEFKMLSNLTYGEFNGIKTDTGPLRQAFSHFASSIYGIQDEVYNYHNVNLCLNVPQKKWMKKLLVSPEILSQMPTTGIRWDFKEVVHASCIALQGKRKASLLWFLSALKDHLAS